MALQLSLTSTDGTAITYHEAVSVDIRPYAQVAFVTYGSWTSSSAKSSGQLPHDINSFQLSGSNLTTFISAFTSGALGYTACDISLQAYPGNPTLGPTWFQQAPWSTATQVANV